MQEVVNVKGKKKQLIGFVDTGEETTILNVLKDNEVNLTLATYVLRETFLGYKTFVSLTAHFPCKVIKPSELDLQIWHIIAELKM